VAGDAQGGGEGEGGRLGLVQEEAIPPVDPPGGEADEERLEQAASVVDGDGILLRIGQARRRHVVVAAPVDGRHLPGREDAAARQADRPGVGERIVAQAQVAGKPPAIDQLGVVPGLAQMLEHEGGMLVLAIAQDQHGHRSPLRIDLGSSYARPSFWSGSKLAGGLSRRENIEIRAPSRTTRHPAPSSRE
jgi:hypothetical protein